jgi:hypothetical protein
VKEQALAFFHSLSAYVSVHAYDFARVRVCLCVFACGFVHSVNSQAFPFSTFLIPLTLCPPSPALQHFRVELQQLHRLIVVEVHRLKVAIAGVTYLFKGAGPAASSNLRIEY